MHFSNRAEYIKEARAKFDSYKTDEWEKNYFDEDTGGFVVTHKGRIALSQKSDNELKKFNKEQNMCQVLAKNGYAVEHLDDRNGNSYDIHLNGIKADLKKTGSHNNIVNYAKEAIRQQGAEIVIFEFEKETDMIHAEILQLKRKGIHGKYYFSKKKDVIYDL